MRSAPEPSLLLLGAGGQFGAELRAALADVGRLVALTRADLDLSDVPRVREVVRAISPAAIVNAAAFTNVDRAESEPAQAFAANATAPGVLAEEAARCGALLVHYSTDYVFDGVSRVPYREEDSPNPLNAYGESKLAGERAIEAVGAPHLILRVSWAYGAHGRNFVRWVLRAARRWRELSVVRDQTSVPTWATRIADGTASVLARFRDGPSIALPLEFAGLYHLVSQGEATRLEFVEAILAEDPERGDRVLERLLPVSSSQFPSPAKRPAYSALDSSRIAARFGVRIPHWRADLQEAAARGITALHPEQAG